jgi:hypothetical protein
MKRILSMLLALSLGAVVLAACGSSPSATSSRPLGTVSGTFTLDAGLSLPQPIDGTVSFQRQHKTGTVSVKVGNSGRFTVDLTPGEWLVSGRSPKFDINNHDPECPSAKPIKVTAHKKTSVQVQCVGK